MMAEINNTQYFSFNTDPELRVKKVFDLVYNAMAEKVTPNCREKCSGCGAARFGGGVCYESKSKMD